MRRWKSEQIQSFHKLAVKRKKKPEEWAGDTVESFIYVVKIEILKYI